jgi:hypothetical protein
MKLKLLCRVAVAARVGGRAHAIVEHALGRARTQIDDPFVEEPFAIRNAPRFKFAPQRLDPRIRFAKYVSLRRKALADEMPRRGRERRRGNGRL